MVTAYCEVGKTIVEEEQNGKKKAAYGERLISNLSKRLSSELGKGFSIANLKDMRLFYQKSQAVPSQLTWTHIRFLLRIEKPDVRSFYEKEALAARWSTRVLERQISSMLYERLALSRDKEGVLALAKKATSYSNQLTMLY